MAKKKLDNKTRELINEKLDKGFIRCSAIVEMMGAPKEYLSKTLKGYIKKLKDNPNLTLIKENYARPKKHDKLFTTFVEIEMMVKDASELAFFCFDYMPSSIEIIEPEKFQYNAPDFAAFFNDMVARLHRLDGVIKNLKAKSQSLERNAGLLLRNSIITHLMYNDELELEELSRKTGIPAQQLSPFLEKLIREKWIKRAKGKYSLAKKAKV
ncbi:hypothetical protein GF345_03865 [Candidatus Woesearchaeota archaeon]|nr:hypothetical protein [Candidatus Woesearchaeota archaeon]